MRIGEGGAPRYLRFQRVSLAVVDSYRLEARAPAELEEWESAEPEVRYFAQLAVQDSAQLEARDSDRVMLQAVARVEMRDLAQLAVRGSYRQEGRRVWQAG